jgi:hypothetical protein
MDSYDNANINGKIRKLNISHKNVTTITPINTSFLKNGGTKKSKKRVKSKNKKKTKRRKTK